MPWLKMTLHAAFSRKGTSARSVAAIFLQTTKHPDLARQFLAFLIRFRIGQAIIPVTNWILPVILLRAADLLNAFAELPPAVLPIDFDQAAQQQNT